MSREGFSPFGRRANISTRRTEALPAEPSSSTPALLGANLGTTAAHSVGASPAAPPGGVRQHEQVQTCEKLQGERGHRKQAHLSGVLPLYDSKAVNEDGHRKGDG